jgi:hypothetical protein
LDSSLSLNFDVNIVLSTDGRSFYVNIGRAAGKECSVTWNLGTNSPFALGPRKITENLDRAGWSQDLPGAY